MTSLREARELAIKAHGDQKYSGEPYIVHLEEVVALLKGYGETAMIVGYLHDVIEDTGVTREELADMFDEHIAACVYLVTDEKGKNRKERKIKTNEKLSLVRPEYYLALRVKAADRLANISRLTKNDMYAKEHEAFKRAVYRPGLCEEYWAMMELILKRSQNG